MLSWIDVKTLAWWMGILLFVVAVIWTTHFILFYLLRRAARRTETRLVDSLIRNTRRPLLLILLSAGLLLVVRSIPADFGPPESLLDAGVRLLSLLMIASVAWLLIRGVNILEDYLLERYRIDVADNLQARKIHTQLRILKRVIAIIVLVIAISAMLMTFDRVRQLGTSILASAGILGLIAGLAAQRSLGTIFAGLQIAITQPIRIDDVIIVEGEWGRVEEITLTYVVIRIWDLRRLIIPVSYFIEKPFQNWTRVSADILGSVFLYLDYHLPLDVLREEFHRLVEISPQWDKKLAVVQITNSTEKSVEVRFLMSAADAGSVWDLRCYVREKMIQFIQANYPSALPRLRTDITNADTSTTMHES